MIYKDHYENGNIANIFHYDNGKLHNFNGPAVISYKRDGSVLREKYYINGKIHRLDGPAYIEYIGDQKLKKYFIKNRFIQDHLWEPLHEAFKNKTFVYNLVPEDDKMVIVYSSLAKYYNWDEAHEYFETYKIIKRLLDD